MQIGTFQDCVHDDYDLRKDNLQARTLDVPSVKGSYVAHNLCYRMLTAMETLANPAH